VLYASYFDLKPPPSPSQHLMRKKLGTKEQEAHRKRMKELTTVKEELLSSKLYAAKLLSEVWRSIVIHFSIRLFNHLCVTGDHIESDC